MKILKTFLLCSLFPIIGFSQSINGVYTGVLSNDSTTIRKDQSFEMALTEYKGKVYGYAYSTFIINDTLYYIVKRVKGKIEGDICEVEDDDVISHNFPQKPEKKVYVTYTLRRNRVDNSWTLDGNWKTNLTKKYYAISGKVDAKEEKDLSKSKLYEHLGDLNLQNTIALEKPKETKDEKKTVDKNDIAKNDKQKDETLTESTNEPIIKSPDNKSVATISSEKPKTNNTINSDLKKPDLKPNTFLTTIITQSTEDEKKDIAVDNTNTIDKNTDHAIAKQETKLSDSKPVTAIDNQQNQNEKKNVTTPPSNQVNKNVTSVNNPTGTNTTTPSNQVVSNEKKNETGTKSNEKKLVSVPVTSWPSQNQTSSNNTNTQVKNNETVTSQPEKKLVSVPVGSKPVTEEKKDAAVSNNKTSDNKQNGGYEFAEIKRTDRRLKPASTLVDSRVSIPSETIFFKADSLSLALYDNGEVDGDTVSVIINDVMFIEKQGLKSSAFRKTFYVPADESDSLLVVLYAENLGKYPPNTGLLQIKDGNDIYYVRFNADLNRNAAIVLRRKSK